MNAMNDNDAVHDDDRPELEDLLKQVSLPEPSAKLDQRMEALLMPRSRSRWIGPLVGFAAGVAVTAMIMPALSARGRDSQATASNRTAPINVAVTSSQSTPSPQVVPFVAEPREIVEYVDGEINGVPVRLQHTRDELELRPRDHSTDIDQASVTLTDYTTIQPVDSY